MDSKNEFQIAVVIEPSVFEPVKFYCIQKETSNAESELVLLELSHSLCPRFVLYDMRLVNLFYHCHV